MMYTVGIPVFMALIGLSQSQPSQDCNPPCRRGWTCQMVSPSNHTCILARGRQNRRACMSDEDCGRNQACRPAPRCQTDCDQNMFCVRVPRNCTVDTDCRRGQTCSFRRVRGCRGRLCEREQVCRRGPKTCEKDEDCEADEDCIVRACQGAECRPGGVCVREGAPGSRICETDADCENGLVCIPHRRERCDGPDCSRKPVTVCRRATTCLRQHRQALAAFRNIAQRTVFVPRCDLRGLWQEVQCIDQLGICWCVNVNTGAQVSNPIKGHPEQCNNAPPTQTPANPQLCSSGQRARVCRPTLCFEQLSPRNHTCRVDPCDGCRAVYLDENNQETPTDQASHCEQGLSQAYISAINKLRSTDSRLFQCVLMTMYDDITLGYVNGLQVPGPEDLLDVMDAAMSSCRPCFGLRRGAVGRGATGRGATDRRNRRPEGMDHGDDDDDDDTTEEEMIRERSRNNRTSRVRPTGRNRPMGPMGEGGHDPAGQVRQLWQTLNRLNTQLNLTKDAIINLLVTELVSANALLRAGRCPMPGSITPEGVTCTKDDDTSCGTGNQKCCPDRNGANLCTDPIHIIIPEVFSACRTGSDGRPADGGYEYKQCFSKSPTYCACVNSLGELRAETVREGGTLMCDQNGIVFEQETKVVSCSRDVAPSMCTGVCLKQAVTCDNFRGIPECIVNICNQCNVTYIKTPSFGGLLYFPTLNLLPDSDGVGPVLTYPGEANLRAMLTRLLDIAIMTSQGHDKDADSGDVSDDPTSADSGEDSATWRRRGAALPLVDEELVTSMAWFHRGAMLLINQFSRGTLPATARRVLGGLAGLLPGGGRPAGGRDRGLPLPPSLSSIWNTTAHRPLVNLTCNGLPPLPSSCDVTKDPSVCDNYQTMEDCIRQCKGFLCDEDTTPEMCKEYRCPDSARCGAYPDLKSCMIDPCTCQPAFAINDTIADCTGPPKGLCVRFKAMSQSANIRRLPRLTCGARAGGSVQGGRPVTQSQRPAGSGQRPAGQGRRARQGRRLAGEGQRRAGQRRRPAGQGQRATVRRVAQTQGTRRVRRPASDGEIWQRNLLPINVSDVQCDGDNFAVKQCGDNECVCVDPLNRPIKGKRGGRDLVCDSMVLDRADFIMRFNGSFQRVDPPRFKQYIGMEIAQLVGVNKEQVFITELKPGSIRTSGYIADGDLSRIVTFIQIVEQDGIEVMYDGEKLVAPPGESQVNLTFTTSAAQDDRTSSTRPTPTMTSPETEDPKSKHKNKLMIIIIVCVLIGLIIIIILSVVCAMRFKKKQSNGDGLGKNMGFKNSGYDSQIDEKAPI